MIEPSPSAPAESSRSPFLRALVRMYLAEPRPTWTVTQGAAAQTWIRPNLEKVAATG